MIIHLENATDVDTEQDLSPAERHVLQKLFGWKNMVGSVAEFRQKKEKALMEGWNNQGSVTESRKLALIVEKFENEIRLRLNGVFDR